MTGKKIPPPEDWKNDPDYDAVHAARFALSRAALAPLLAPGDPILECGDPGSFARGLVTEFGLDLRNAAADLRYPGAFARFSAASFAGVLCMELIEHIHDMDADKPTEWRATGTATLLAGILRVLRPGGWLFLTTPNACSLNVLDKVLTMQAPMVYRPHVREYAPAEIVALLVGSGFAIESFTTHDCWGGGCNSARRREIEAMLARAACPSPHRGEDCFVLARKPAAPSAHEK